MITIYMKNGCAFSGRVFRVVEELEIQVEQRNIKDDEVSEELIELGGKRQVPFMVDNEHDVKMYESKDIVKYLCEHYGGDPEDYSEEVQHLCRN